MIDHNSPASQCIPWKHSDGGKCIQFAPCFTPWVFMEFHDLFGDQSKDGDFHRVACLHEINPDGSCPNCPNASLAACWQTKPECQSVRVAAGSQFLPRPEIRTVLQSGDELSLEFESDASFSDNVLAETAHILRKLRNTGIAATVSGLSTADKAKLSRLEWSRL